MKKPPIFVKGMQGLGDNIHQRAVVRELLKTNEVWLETPWPCLYIDLPVHVVAPVVTKLRTQAKNATREAHRYIGGEPPGGAQVVQVRYVPDVVRQRGSVLAAMCAEVDVPVGDFRMQVQPEWAAKADWLARHWPAPEDRPLMIYRPMTVRAEWGGNAVRNADPDSYREIFEAVRGTHWVVSVADADGAREQIVSRQIEADATYEAGELDIETVIALVARASLVFTSSGFAVPMAQAIGTPVISVFGGYESSWSFSPGARYAPYLGIDTMEPCSCFSHRHQCDRRIDVPTAIKRCREFVEHTSEAAYA